MKTGGAHKYLNFCSLKNCTTDYYKEAFQTSKIFDVNEAYSNLFQKLMAVIEKLHPVRASE